MEVHPAVQDLARRFLPGWLVDRIDPFQAEIRRFVDQAGRDTEEQMRVLDAGAGESRHADYFRHARYAGLDLRVGDPRWDYGRVSVCADVTHLPFLDSSFDRILCVVTLEHVQNPGDAIKEFARALRRGGKLYLVTPLMWEEHQLPHDYYRFTSSGLRLLLESAGLEVESIRPIGGYFWMFGRRSVGMLTFFQTSWKWIFFPLVAAVAGGIVPVACYYLDRLDREKSHTLGHCAQARKKLRIGD